MAGKKKAAGSIQCWAFIDTNIFLDFYRSNNEARIPLLQKIREVEGRIISTYQVQMEFLKHRQEVLLKALQEMKTPITPSPAVIDDGHIEAATRKIREYSDKRTKYLKSRIANMLLQPNTHDQVYQALDHLFSNPSEHALKRSMNVRKTMKRQTTRLKHEAYKRLRIDLDEYRPSEYFTSISSAIIRPSAKATKHTQPWQPFSTT